MSLIVTLVIFLIVFNTDGKTLQVDRWSAMDVAIRAILNGKYPYTAVDHLHGRTSNFPGLLILGIPFYLLGNVGYLQVFAFLLLSFTLYKFLDILQAFHYMLLLLISPAYWWEVFAISDLFSNIIILVCFIILLEQNMHGELFRRPVFLGVTTAFITLTRGVVLIPLTLFLFKEFWKITAACKAKFIASYSLTFALLITIVLINCPTLQTLKHYNPLVLQTTYLPNYIHFIALILPFLFTFRISSFRSDFFKYASILIFLPVIVSFIYRCFLYGFNLNFDLSYFSMAIPFLLFEIVQRNKCEAIVK